MVETIIIRPTSDDTRNHSLSRGSSGYSLISEEVADGDSTYIYQTVSNTTDESVTSVFNLDGGDLGQSISVKKIKLCVNGCKKDGTNPKVSFWATVSGEESLKKEETLTSSYKEFSYELTPDNFPPLKENFNSFTEMGLQVHISTTGKKDASKDSSYQLRITQLYAQIEYELINKLKLSTSITGNGTIDPDGQYEVPFGNDVYIGIYPYDMSEEIKLLDNDEDKSSLIESKQTELFQVIGKTDDVSYGFENETLSGNTYYRAKNKAVSRSIAKSEIRFTIEDGKIGSITVSYVNYAESASDYMGFGKLDTDIGNNYSSMTANNCLKLCSTSGDNINNVQTVTYSGISSGEHFIQIGYRKDANTNQYLDGGYFRIASKQNIKTLDYFEYHLSNYSKNHNIFVKIGYIPTNSLYIKQNERWVEVTNFYIKQSGRWIEKPILEAEKYLDYGIFLVQ